MVKVSIVTPVYNRPEYIEEAVVSIQNQTFVDLEHIIVNDGATNPDTRKIVERISQKYHKVKVYHKENGGPGSARNFGIERAQGEFIFPFDDDDILDKDFIQKGVNILEKDCEVGVVTSWIQAFGTKKFLIKPQGGRVENFLISNNSCGNALFRKTLWESCGKYDENRIIIGYEDWDFWIRLTALGYNVHVIQEALFNYRVMESKASLHRDALQKHLSLFKYIIEKNESIYSANLTDSLLMFEKKIIETREYYEQMNIIGLLKRLVKRVF